MGQSVRDVLGGARATGGDHRHVHRVGDGAGDLEVVARRGAVVVDAVDDDLARTELLAVAHPFDRIHAGGESRAVDEHLVPTGDLRRRFDALHLGAQHDALTTECFGALADDVGLAHRHRVDADLLRSCFEHFEHVVDGADAAAHGEGHEDVLRDGAHRVEVDLASLRARHDVVEDDLVDLIVVQALRELRRRRHVDVVLELLRLRDSSVDDVEAGDETLGQHPVPSHAAKPRSSRSPSSPLFSAWNCVAMTLPRATTEQNSTP